MDSIINLSDLRRLNLPICGKCERINYITICDFTPLGYTLRTFWFNPMLENENIYHKTIRVLENNTTNTEVNDNVKIYPSIQI